MEQTISPVGKTPTVFYYPLLTGVQAGYPSPAESYAESVINLDEELIQHPAATVFVRMVGESMLEAHIVPGSILVVDKALDPKDGSIVLAVVDGEITTKRLRISMGKQQLLPDNPKFKPIEIHEHTECRIIGVVTYIITDSKLV